ncbi:MAG: hypothetical protein ACPG7F_10990 [Aggregatilineales bacterium]
MSETRFSFKIHYLLPALIIALAYALHVLLIFEPTVYDCALLIRLAITSIDATICGFLMMDAGTLILIELTV